MNELKVRMNFVANEEDVARMLFSPLFICVKNEGIGQ